MKHPSNFIGSKCHELRIRRGHVSRILFMSFLKFKSADFIKFKYFVLMSLQKHSKFVRDVKKSEFFNCLRLKENNFMRLAFAKF